MSLQHIAVIILAAGSSSRMGSSKQLLVVDEEPLLRQTAKVAIASGVKNIIVVLGANTEAHKEILNDLPVEITENPAWRNGMGSSLKAGMSHVLNYHGSTRGTIILVCDQPLLRTDHLLKLIHAHQHSHKSIVASTYANTIGVPAFFEKAMFQQLMEMDDAEGAKKIILRNTAAMSSIDFPEGEIDLDTPHDVNRFKKNTQ